MHQTILPAFPGIKSSDCLIRKIKEYQKSSQRAYRMSRGGKRPGAGRPKGSKDKKTVERETLMAKMIASDCTPMQFHYAVMNNADAPFAYRHRSAEILMRFVHPALSAIETTVTVRSFEDRLRDVRPSQHSWRLPSRAALALRVEL